MEYRSIALGGGGTRGGLHVGALRAIQEIKGDLVFPDGIYAASAGAFAAVAIGFGMSLDGLKRIYDKHFTFSNFLPKPKVDHLLTLLDRKGAFPMDTLMERFTQAFLEEGVDLRGKTLADAHQTLYIVASNMTTGRPTLLTGKVPVLDALRCTACLPLIFEPQILYGDLYLDAGVHLRCLRDVVPKNTLVVHISGTCGRITPESSLSEMLFSCYSGKATQYFGENVLRIKNVKFGLIGELSQADRDYLVREGYLQTRQFFAKRLANKLK